MTRTPKLISTSRTDAPSIGPLTQTQQFPVRRAPASYSSIGPRAVTSPLADVPAIVGSCFRDHRIASSGRRMEHRDHHRSVRTRPAAREIGLVAHDLGGTAAGGLTVAAVGQQVALSRVTIRGGRSGTYKRGPLPVSGNCATVPVPHRHPLVQPPFIVPTMPSSSFGLISGRTLITVRAPLAAATFCHTASRKRQIAAPRSEPARPG